MKNVLLFCAFLLTNLNFSCKKESISTPSQLSKKLSELHAKSILPGFAVSIIKGDSIYFQQGFGYADRVNKTPYTPNTIQPIGSVSKTFVALALMQCVEKGLFTLETDVNDILPFDVKNPNHLDKPIKIKHLATHTSGILDNPTFYFQTYELGKTPSKTLAQVLSEYFVPGSRLYAPANFGSQEPDVQYNYTNFGAALAAYIIEVKTGEPFDTFTKRTILTPLNMSSTDWFYDDTKQANYATLYEVNPQIDPIYDQVLNPDRSVKTYCSMIYPDGSLKTSCADLTKYLLEMVKGYDKKGSLLNQSNYSTLFAPRYTTATLPTDMDEKEPNRAIFWAITRTGRVSHTGGDLGVSAFVSYNPITKTGRVLTMNTQLDGDDNVLSVNQFTEIANVISAYETGL
jgi:CubicO group peptidase (beta-lactamase class C family)